jgi:hypothetical protein
MLRWHTTLALKSIMVINLSTVCRTLLQMTTTRLLHGRSNCACICLCVCVCVCVRAHIFDTFCQVVTTQKTFLNLTCSHKINIQCFTYAKSSLILKNITKIIDLSNVYHKNCYSTYCDHHNLVVIR